MPREKREDDPNEPRLGGGGVVVGDLEFTDDTGEMDSASANVNPGPQGVNIPLSGTVPKTGSVTGTQMGGPTNVTSVEFIAPDISKTIHTSQPGAYITKASATHAASVLALTGMEQRPVLFTGPVNYRDERQPPMATQVQFELVTATNDKVVQTRPLVNGVLEDTSPPPGLVDVVMLLIVVPDLAPKPVSPGMFFTTLDASTTTAAGTVVDGHQAPPPPESPINA